MYSAAECEFYSDELTEDWQILRTICSRWHEIEDISKGEPVLKIEDNFLYLDILLPHEKQNKADAFLGVYNEKAYRVLPHKNAQKLLHKWEQDKNFMLIDKLFSHLPGKEKAAMFARGKKKMYVT
jgi:hypothetical protein